MKCVGVVEVDALECVIIVTEVLDELVDEMMVGVKVVEIVEVLDRLVFDMLVEGTIKVMLVDVLDVLDILEVELVGVTT